MSISNIDIATIAQCLRVRQKLRGPTLLFVGAKAGALFHSETLYDALQYFSPRPFATLNQVERFHACVHFLEQERFSEAGVHYILSRSLEDSFIHDSDKYIAALIKYNFFHLIATTNIDVGLEAALDWIGLRVRSDFDVFLPGASSSRPAPSLSKEDANNKPKTLVKLYGELALGHYNIKQRGKLFIGNTQLFQDLRNMRNWNILMVSFDPVWDAAIIPVLLPCTGTIWYVNEEAPAQNSAIFQMLQASNAHCLLGTDGSSQKFFRSLYQHLIGSAPLFDPRAEPVPTVAHQSTPLAVSKPPKPQAIAHASSSPHEQNKVDVLLLAVTERDPTVLLNQRDLIARKYAIRGRTYYDLGKIGDASVCLLQANETDRSIAEQIRELSPACIVILGTAWGFNYKGQCIGSLLIPDRIFVYDIEQGRSSTPRTTGTDAFHLMGGRQRVVPKQLINLFQCGNIMLNRKTKKLALVTFGTMFSCATQLDEQTAFRYASKFAPDTIGIETSGATLFSLAQSYQNNCLLVAGISALVDIAEATNQKVANVEGTLKIALDFILQVIALGGFHDLERDSTRSK